MKKFRRIGVLLLTAALCLTGCGGGGGDSENESLTAESGTQTEQRAIEKALTLFSEIREDAIPYVMEGYTTLDCDTSELARLLRTLGTEYYTEMDLVRNGYPANFISQAFFAVEQDGEKQVFSMGGNPDYSLVSAEIDGERIFFKNRALSWWLYYGGKSEAKTMEEYRTFLTSLETENFDVETDPAGTPEFDEAFLKETMEILWKTADEMGRQYYIWEEEGGEYWTKPDIMKQERSELSFAGRDGDVEWKIVLTAGRQKQGLVKVRIGRWNSDKCEIFIRNQEIYDWVLDKGQRDENKKYSIDEAAYQKFKTELDAYLQKVRQTPLFAELGGQEVELIYFQRTAHYQKDGLELECYYLRSGWVAEDLEKAMQKIGVDSVAKLDEWGRVISGRGFAVQYKDGKPLRTCFLDNDIVLITNEYLEYDFILNEVLSALEGSQD